MVKALIFDHDGVIIDSEKSQIAAWQQFFNSYGMHYSEKELPYITRGRTARDIIASIFDKKADVEKLAEEREKLHFAMLQKDLRLIPGIDSFLPLARKNGFFLAVATSARRYKLMHALQKFRLDHYFDTIVTSEDVKKGKPAPDSFLLAASKLDVEPRECVVFEDSIKGANAAEKAGTKLIIMTTSHKKEEFNNKNIIGSFPDFASTENIFRIINPSV